MKGGEKNVDWLGTSELEGQPNYEFPSFVLFCLYYCPSQLRFCLLLLIYPDLVARVACSSEMPVGKDKTKGPKTLKPKDWENGKFSFYDGNPFDQTCYFS